MAFGINIPVGFKLNNAGLKSAKKEFSSFGEHVKKGLEFAGIAVGIGEILNVAKESIGLAAQDLKSRKLLDLQIKTSTHSTLKQVEANEKYLDSLSMQVGVTKNELRPALSNAVRGTGSLSAAQKILKIALDGAAATGKPLNVVMQALIKANNGQTTSLYKLAPQLKKTKGGVDDFAKSVANAAATAANPFDKFKVAMDELKIKLGTALMPSLQKVTDYLIKNVIPQVSQFLDDLSNPKSDAGKTFYQIKEAVKQTFKGVKDFFALFGNGDAMKGFGNVASALVKMLPALLAFKGILALAAAGKTVMKISSAIAALSGQTKAGQAINSLPIEVKVAAAGQAAAAFATDINRDELKKKTNKTFTLVSGTSEGVMALPQDILGIGRKTSRVAATAPTQIIVNSYGSTPAQFNSLVRKALDEHNRLNGKK
jgi:hypothetical protein